MRQYYEYPHTCPECGEDWMERCLRPKQQTDNKICLDCKNKEVSEFSGLGSEKNCGNCKYFQPLSENNCWGRCLNGRYLKNEKEYTLTYAIDNLSRCVIKPEDYEDYEQDVLKLVNDDCVCNKHEYKEE